MLPGENDKTFGGGKESRLTWFHLVRLHRLARDFTGRVAELPERRRPDDAPPLRAEGTSHAHEKLADRRAPHELLSDPLVEPALALVAGSVSWNAGSALSAPTRLIRGRDSGCAMPSVVEVEVVEVVAKPRPGVLRAETAEHLGVVVQEVVHVPHRGT